MAKLAESSGTWLSERGHRHGQVAASLCAGSHGAGTALFDDIRPEDSASCVGQYEPASRPEPAPQPSPTASEAMRQAVSALLKVQQLAENTPTPLAPQQTPFAEMPYLTPQVAGDPLPYTTGVHTLGRGLPGRAETSWGGPWPYEVRTKELGRT